MKWAWYERFEGHLSNEDPRTPVTAAGACIFPTVPAHRYLLISGNATGMLWGLNWMGILMEKVSIGSAHDLCQWNMLSAPAPITIATMFKRKLLEPLRYQWEIEIGASACGTIAITVPRPHEKCNVDFQIGNHCCPYQPLSCTGSMFKAFQVEHDKTLPPQPPT